LQKEKPYDIIRAMGNDKKLTIIAINRKAYIWRREQWQKK
jgi:hypothetical protein